MVPRRGADPDLVDFEVDLLLDAVYRRTGYDFREYARASIKRRVLERASAEAAPTVTALLERALHDPEAMERLLLGLSVRVTAMFRDPDFYLSFRQRVVPLLRTYPFTRIWHAGCSTGEEVYSMAILLHEEGLYERCRIYATDVSEGALRRAREGFVPLAAMQDYTANYLAAGGARSFSEYYTAAYGGVIFRAALREQVVFAQHNLAVDSSFNEFNVVLCRNVMIYFNKALQDRVHALLYESLARHGVLALGRRESLRFTPHEDDYEVLDERTRLFRKPR